MNIENITGNGMTYFIAIDEGEEIGKADYFMATNGSIAITHVGINMDNRGQGKGDEFVKCIVDYARDNGLSIQPYCSFARSVFARHPEFHDVL